MANQPNLDDVNNAWNSALGYLENVGNIVNGVWDLADKYPHIGQKTTDIYLRETSGEREMRFPWLPESFEYKSGQAVTATHDIMGLGPVIIPLGTNLEELSWSGILPGEKRGKTSLDRGEIQAPDIYHNLLKEWKTKKTELSVMVTSSPVYFDCFVYDYSGRLTGAFGDIEYTIVLKQIRNVTVTVKSDGNNDKDESGGITITYPETTRPTEQKKTYTIKQGDSMWIIAQKFYGNGLKWTDIYKANKTVLDKKAKEMGYPNNNGSYIFPGTTITIP